VILELRAGDASWDKGELPGRSKGKEVRGEDAILLEGWMGVEGWTKCEEEEAGMARELGRAEMNWPNLLQSRSLFLPFFIKRVERGEG
jgi:hypothetical protein